jgi:dienelactone hydrolase
MDETQWSPTELWKEFDPAHDDLDCQILERREDEDCVVTELTYFSHECEGEPIWVYGILGIPKSDETVPGVLHIHGGGQTANEAHVRRMIEEGYAALTFDWTGPTDDREKVTDFGMASTDKYRIEPGPEYSHLYHATAIARRGLTLLAGQPEVDESRLGIYGISWGGFLSWLVNGTDERVKAATAIYGCGGTLKWGNTGGTDFDPENEEQRLWSFCFSPYQYAGTQSGPMLFLNCTNDFFGWMDTAEDLFDALDDRHALAFCPHFNHHIDEDVSTNLYEWLATHLNGDGSWLPRPEVEIRRESGQLIAEIDVESEEIEDVEIFVASNHVPSPCRYWHLCPEDGETTGHFPIPIVNQSLKHAVFANVYYEDGTCISSVPQTITPSDHGKLEDLALPSLIIDDFSEGIGGWYLNGLGTEPFPEPLQLNETDGPGETPSLTIEPVLIEGESFSWILATRRIADLRWMPNEYEGLLIVIRAKCIGPLKVRLTHRPGMSDAETFTAALDEIDERWSSLELTPSQFKGIEEDSELETFDQMHLLEIIGTSPRAHPPIIDRVEWM